MGSFAQISLGVLILAAAFIFGQFVNQQNEAQQTANSSPVQSPVDDTAWQNNSGESLFEFEAPAVPDNFQSFPETGSRPPLPFSRSEQGAGQSIDDSSGQVSRMPNHVPLQEFETTIQPNSSMPVAPEMLSLPSSPQSAPNAPENRPAEEVPLIEPDFSGLRTGNSAPELNYLPGQYFDGRETTETSLLELRVGNSNSDAPEAARPAAPEFTIYPDAGRPSPSDFQASDNPENIAQGQGIAPIGEPLSRPTAPTSPRVGNSDSVASSGGSFVPPTGSAPANDRSWIDDFNEPFVTRQAAPVREETEPAPRRGAVSVVERPIIPERDETTQPQLADSSMIPFMRSTLVESAV
ncbi:MAG: hypothetical protein AAF456_11800 [Planctomycetota bacterium]